MENFLPFTDDVMVVLVHKCVQQTHLLALHLETLGYILIQADKGSTVVLMNRDDYIAEVERQLNDTKFYKKNLMKIHRNNFERT